MTCTIERSQLQRLRDGEFEPNRVAELAAHVDGCVRCQGVLADLEVLGELLTEQRAAAASKLPSDFSARVMSLLPASHPVEQPWVDRMSEFARRHREALAFSLFGAALAASLAIVFAPGLRSQADRSQEAAENEAQIHQLDTGSDQNAVVLQSAEGNTVIWLVSPAAEEDGGAPKASP